MTGQTASDAMGNSTNGVERVASFIAKGMQNCYRFAEGVGSYMGLDEVLGSKRRAATLIYGAGMLVGGVALVSVSPGLLGATAVVASTMAVAAEPTETAIRANAEVAAAQQARFDELAAAGIDMDLLYQDEYEASQGNKLMSQVRGSAAGAVDLGWGKADDPDAAPNVTRLTRLTGLGLMTGIGGPFGAVVYGMAATIGNLLAKSNELELEAQRRAIAKGEQLLAAQQAPASETVSTSASAASPGEKELLAALGEESQGVDAAADADSTQDFSVSPK